MESMPTIETDYADVEIRILQREAKGYPIEITLNDEQQYPRGYLQLNFLPWVSTASPADDGQRLFGWLLADPKLGKAWAEIRGQTRRRRVRLRIDPEAPELHPLPWELLREVEPGSAPLDLAAAEATPFSRYLAGKWQPGSPVLKRPIRILVAIANPEKLDRQGLTPIEGWDEWLALQQAVAGPGAELVPLPPPCSLARIEQELNKGYHVLHVLAHGSYAEEDRQAVLYLADGQNQVTRVYDTEIAEMLARQLADADIQQDDKLRLVFLASCQTATRSPADAFRGLAPQLVAAGVPAVVAMQDPVDKTTARTFAGTFYQRLLEHGLVDLAANQARSALLTARLPGAAIPVLFMRLDTGRLFADVKGGGVAAGGSESDYNLAAVRDLLLAAFTAADLRRLFLYSGNAELQPLTRQFSDGDGLEAMVEKTIQHCAKQGLFPDLLAEVQRANPRQYARFAGRKRE